LGIAFYCIYENENCCAAVNLNVLISVVRIVVAMQWRFTPDFSRIEMTEFAVPNGGR
jgi:hypothetical protein